MSLPEKLFQLVEETDEKCVFRLLDPKMPKGKRMDVALQIPEQLHNAFDMTKEEFQGFSFTKMTSRKSIYLKSGLGKNETEVCLAEWVSPADTKRLGLWPILLEYREIMADKEFYGFLDGALNSQHRAVRGNAIDLTSSTQPCHRNGGIHMSLAGRKACLPGNEQFREKMQRCVVLLGMANEIILQNTFDQKTRELFKTVYEDRRIAEASLTNGHPMTNGIQVNFFDLKNGVQSNTSTLTSRGDPHPDKNDEPGRRSIMYFVEANTPDVFFPGWFNILSARVSCQAEEFSVLLLDARHPHFSSGRGIADPSTPPSRSYQNKAGVPKLLGEQYVKGKFHTVCYCRQDSARARLNEIHAELFDKPKGCLHMGGEAHWQEWRMLTHIKNNIEEIRAKTEASEAQAPEMFMEQFKWWDENEKVWKYPPRRSVEICLEKAGKEDKAREVEGKVAMWPDCGTKVPEDEKEDSAEAAKKRKGKYWRMNKKKGIRPQRCTYIHIKGQCKKLCWGPKCARHAGEEENCVETTLPDGDVAGDKQGQDDNNVESTGPEEVKVGEEEC